MMHTVLRKAVCHLACWALLALAPAAHAQLAIDPGVFAGPILTEPPGTLPHLTPLDPEPSPLTPPAPATQPAEAAPFEDAGDFGVKTYHWHTKYGHYAVVLLENRTQADLRAEVNVVFHDAGGNMVGVASETVQVIDPGRTSYALLRNDAPFAAFEYDIVSASPTYYRGVLSALDTEASQAGSKIIVSVQNTSDTPISFAQGLVLFFYGGEVVDYSTGYFTDADFEIKPGRSVFKEFSTHQLFDAHALYLAAYGQS